MPALVDFDNSVIDAAELSPPEAGAGSGPDKYRLLKRIVNPIMSDKDRIAPVAVARMLDLLRATTKRPRILVIGGGTVGLGIKFLYDDPDVEIVAFDIFASPVTQFIGDGHAIPLADGSIDGVVIQAVLEHVVEPGLVVSEIYRVLREGGIVFAGTPFMQQVHLGPWDFTRFTDSGHRYLFRRFEHIDSGAVTGAGTALLWSINYYVRALTRSMRLGQLAKLCFFWLRYTDALLDPGYSLDAASGVFFLGRKSSQCVTSGEIIRYYKGGMRPKQLGV